MKRTLRGIGHKATTCVVTLAMVLGSMNTGIAAMAAEKHEEVSSEAFEEARAE